MPVEISGFTDVPSAGDDIRWPWPTIIWAVRWSQERRDELKAARAADLQQGVAG